MQSRQLFHLRSAVNPLRLQRTVHSSALDSLLPPAGSWQLNTTSTALERTFKFRTFRSAWSFMSLVATHAASQRHHPEWSNIYNRVFVRWTTHSEGGLSGKDVEGARACDGFAVKVQGNVDGGVVGDGGDVRGLVEDVRKGGEGQDAVDGKAGEEKERLREKQKIEKEEEESGKEGSLAGVGGQPSFAALSL